MLFIVLFLLNVAQRLYAVRIFSSYRNMFFFSQAWKIIAIQIAGQLEHLKPVTALYLWSLSVLPTIVLDVALACSVWTARLRSYVSSEKQLVCVDWQLIALWFNLVRDFQKCCVHSDLEIGAPHSLCVQNFNAPKKRDKGPPWWCHSPVSKQALAAGEGPGQDILWPSSTIHHGPSTSPWPPLNQRTNPWCEVQVWNLSWTGMNSKYFWPQTA